MPRFFRLLPSIALAAAAALVLALSVQARRLRGDLEEARRRAERPYPGFAVPALALPRLGRDDPVVIGAQGARRNVLFFFTTTCPLCRETAPQWKRIAAEVAAGSRGEVEVYGISFDSAATTLAYATEHALPYPVLLATPEARVSELYRAVGVPLTLIVDSARVVHARFGSLAPAPAAVDSIVAIALRGSQSMRP